MDKLPPEILRRIFVLLSLNQRLGCNLVCRSWKNVLDSSTLFYSVELNQTNVKRFNRMIRMFEESPHEAAKVKELELHPPRWGIILSYFNRRTLLDIFPNAHTIKLFQSSYELGKTRQFRDHIDLKQATSKVESLLDFQHCEVLSQILSSNLGANLKTLCLNFQKVSTTSDTLCRLKGLPCLRKLSLVAPKIDLFDLETVHKNLPSIQDFAIVDIHHKSGAMPSNIVPAASILKLKIINGSPDPLWAMHRSTRPSHFRSAKAHTQFYQYMTKKYTNVKNATYSDKSLVDYNTNVLKLIYLTGIINFLKLIGSSMSELTLYGCPNGVDVFEILDGMDSKLKSLYIHSCKNEHTFRFLSQSNQAKYIENFSALKSSFTSIDFLENMTALNSLDISVVEHDSLPFPLTDCLAACPPTLKKFSVSCTSLVIEPLKMAVNSIETLSIGVKTLSSHLGDFISSWCPNLVRLDISGEVTENIKIILKSPHFLEATFSTADIYFSRYPLHGASFLCPSQTEPQYYLCNIKEPGSYQSKKKLVQYDDIKDLPILSVVSLTEKKVELSDSIKVVPC